MPAMGEADALVAEALGGVTPFVKRDEVEILIRARGYITRAEAEQMVNHALNRMMTQFVIPMTEKLAQLENPLSEEERLRRAIFGPDSPTPL